MEMKFRGLPLRISRVRKFRHQNQGFLGKPRTRSPTIQAPGPQTPKPRSPKILKSKSLYPDSEMQQTPPTTGGGRVPTPARAGDRAWRPRGRRAGFLGGVSSRAAASYLYVILVIMFKFKTSEIKAIAIQKNQVRSSSQSA